MNSTVTLLLALVLLTGCGKHYTSANPLKRAAQFAYCNQMEADGKHCKEWATSCGELHCGGR